MAPGNTTADLRKAIRESGKRTLRRLYMVCFALLAFWTLIFVLVR